MISLPEVTVERISCVSQKGADLASLAREVIVGKGYEEAGGVLAATFSNAQRFPSLAVRVAEWLGLPKGVPAFDLQMACSAYPLAVYLASKLAEDTGRKILVVNGDVQTPLVDAADAATGKIFSDACTASLVGVRDARVRRSSFSFLSHADEAALSCSATGPIRMDGFKVFSFVATEVVPFLRPFCAETFDTFAPHQANAYMVRQLADELGLSSRLVTLDETLKNPGSCSIPLTLATRQVHGRTLIAGFGAGFSAAAGIVTVL